jgi:hypothetical protein
VKTFFIDCEASSLDQGSFPIEIAWVDQAGLGESYLICPEADWTNWSLQSQKIHGISRKTLWQLGKPASFVARRVLAVLKNNILVSDNPAYDGYWLSMLLGTIQETDIGLMLNFDTLIGQEIKRMTSLIISNEPDSPAFWYQHRVLLDEGQLTACAAIDPLILVQRVRHRALPDAQHLWAKWKAAKEAIDNCLKLHP